MFIQRSFGSMMVQPRAASKRMRQLCISGELSPRIDKEKSKMQTKVAMSGFPVSLYVCLENVHTREPGQAEAGNCGCLSGGTKDWEVRVGDFSLKPFCTFCILYHVQLLTIQKN